MHTNYVISLTTARQRREHIKQEFGRQNISFEFYDALTPSEHLTTLIQTYLPNLAHAKLSDGEKACFMSHYMLWKKCIDENLPYIYIFEDDVLLGKDAYYLLEEDEWLKERFNSDEKYIFRFETFLKPAKCKKTNISNYKSRFILQLIEEQYGLAAYIISKNAILKLFNLISKLPSEKLDAIDILAFRYFLNRYEITSYQLSPAICVQELQKRTKRKSFLNSQLEKDRKIVQKEAIPRKKRTLVDWFIKGITKPIRIANKIKKNKEIIKFE